MYILVMTFGLLMLIFVSVLCAEVDFIDDVNVPDGCYIIVGEKEPTDLIQRKQLIVSN